MSEQKALRYENFTAKSLAIFGDRELYDNILKDIGGKWNPRMKPQPGWYIDKSQEDKLKKLIVEINGTSSKLPEEVVKVNPVVKEKRKYTKKVKDLPVLSEIPESKVDVVKPKNVDVVKPKKSEVVVVESKPKKSEVVVVESKPKKSESKSVLDEDLGDSKKEEAHDEEAHDEDEDSEDEDSEDEDSEDEDLGDSKKEEAHDEDSNKSEANIDDEDSNKSEAKDEHDKTENTEDVETNSLLVNNEKMREQVVISEQIENTLEKRRVKNPNHNITKKSREKFINNYVNSDDDIDEEESRDMLEKYQNLFLYFKTYSEKPEKFNEDKVKNLKKQTI